MYVAFDAGTIDGRERSNGEIWNKWKVEIDSEQETHAGESRQSNGQKSDQDPSFDLAKAHETRSEESMLIPVQIEFQSLSGSDKHQASK